MHQTLRKPFRALLAAVLLLVVAAIAAGCGSSKKNNTTSSPVANAANATPATKVTAGHFTIGYGEPAAVDEVTNRNVSAMKWAAQQLGWDLKFTNAQGNIGALTQALTNYANEGVNAIVVGSTDAKVIRPALLAAKRNNIPAVVIGGGVPTDPLYAANVTEGEKQMSKLITQFMVKDLGGSGDIAAINISQLSSGIDRRTARDEVLKGTGIKIVAQADGDLADPIKGTQKIAADIIAKNPHIKAFWLVYDYMIGPTVTVLKQAGLAGKVKIYSWFAGPDNVRLLRDPATGVRGLIEDNFDHTALTAMDDIAGHLAAKKPLAADPLASDPMKYTVVTKDNAPPPGQLLFPFDQNRQPFQAKWAAGNFG